jgi:dipeptidyl aminopeptidase/acylaminoacyl peptidase
MRNRSVRLAAAAAVATAVGAATPAAAQQPQQPVIAPTENLVVEGIPPIPASLAEEVRRYTEARSASLADWHPARREMLISTRFGNTAQVHRVAAPGGARTQLTFFDEPVAGVSYEPRTGAYFVFGRDVGGNEFAQLYRYDLADGRVTLLTDGGRSQNGAVTWNRAGDRMVYASTRRNGRDRDLWAMDPANPSTDQMILEVSGGGWFPLDWSPDGGSVLVMEYISVNRSNLWLADARTGERRLLTGEGGEAVAWSGGAFAPDGRGIYTTTDRDGEFRRLVRLDVATGATTPLSADIEWDVEQFALSRDGRMLAFAVNEAGASRLYLMETATRDARRVDGVPTGVIGALSWHPAGGELGFSMASARSTSDVYSLDPATGRVERWTESELGGLVPGELSEPELIRWNSFDGLEITGFYYRPPARFTGPRPVIVSIHGGPEAQSRPGFQGRNNYYLNELGVAIVYPNVRGSTGFGKTFVQLDNEYKREDSVRDIGALLDWIATRPELDASRVMVTGGSYGGYMTLATATNYPERICCAVNVVGISHFGTFLRNTEDYRRDLRRVEYGDERDPRMAAFFDSISPLNNAHRITKPLFVVQGGNDPRVPLSEAEQIVEAVRRNGSTVWYLMARDEGHGFRKKANADFQFYSTVMFVRRYLLGEE